MNTEGTTTERPVLRRYDDARDKEDIAEMCKNVYGGTDRVPHACSFYAKDERCIPYVAMLGNTTAAFCNVRLFKSDNQSPDVTYIECVRVAESLRGKGIGTALIRDVVHFFASKHDSVAKLRFLSTTVPGNEAMLRIFENTGWVCRGRMHIWPSERLKSKIRDIPRHARGTFLDAIRATPYIPQYARDSIPLWKHLDSATDMWTSILQLRARGVASLVPRFYAVTTFTEISRAMEQSSESQQQLSAWKLERKNLPPVLLFIQEVCKPSEPLPKGCISACVSDLLGAECCVAFAASREDLDLFSIVFDPVITKDAMQSSPLLSRAEFSSFFVFEAQR